MTKEEIKLHNRHCNRRRDLLNLFERFNHHKRMEMMYTKRNLRRIYIKI